MTDKPELHQALVDAENALALASKAFKEAFEGLTHTPATTAEPSPTEPSPEHDPAVAATPAVGASAS